MKPRTIKTRMLVVCWLRGMTILTAQASDQSKDETKN